MCEAKKRETSAGSKDFSLKRDTAHPLLVKA